jgi:hypothetical protein
MFCVSKLAFLSGRVWAGKPVGHALQRKRGGWKQEISTFHPHSSSPFPRFGPLNRGTGHLPYTSSSTDVASRS